MLRNIFSPPVFNNIFRSAPTYDTKFQDSRALSQPQSSSGNLGSVFNELQELIRQQPQRNKPGIGRRIVAGLAGLHADPEVGMKAAEQIKYAPYLRESEDWQTKVNNFLNTAKVESERDSNQRLLERQTKADEVARLQLERQIRADEERARAARAREATQEKLAEIRERYQQLREVIANRPNMIPRVGEDGYVWLINKNDPEGKAVKTQVKTGELSDLDKLQIGLDNDLARIAAKGEEDRETKIAPSGSTTNRPVSQLDQNRELVAKANRIISENPELKDYIKIDGNNVTVVPNSVSSIRARMQPEVVAEREALYRKALQLVYGDNPPVSAATPVGTADKVEVIAPDGRRGRIPANQLEAALAQGFKRAN